MTSSKRNTLSPLPSDALLIRLLGTAAAIASGLMLLVVLFLLSESWPMLRGVGVARFFHDGGWNPTEGRFGLAPMLAGSLAAAAGATALAGPLGAASALFIRFYAPQPLARIFRWILAVLAGVPSVVLGLWAMTALTPAIARWQPPGASLLAGILVLTLMILPTVALAAEAALASAHDSHWRASAALGLSREGAIIGVVLPAARGGVTAGVLLAAARALGETMAVLMVSGNVVQTPTSLFDPVRTLTANIALEMAYATGDHRASLFVSGLALVALVLALAALAGRLGGGRVHG